MLRICLPAGAVMIAAICASAQSPTVVLNLEKTPHARIRNIPVSAVRIQPGFWSERRKTNVEKSIPTMLTLLEEHGTLDNFRRLTGKKNVPRQGPLYTDSDIYKWIEAVAFVLQTERNPQLEATVDSLTDEIVAAQEPNGYLNTYYQDENKTKRFQEMDRGHELYCLGHLLQAAIAYHRATGKRKLLDAGIRFADYLVKDFGPDKQPLLAGHPEIEMALVELYRTTGERKYLDLAGYILRGERERLKLRPSQLTYMFSGRPFTERTFMEGHAVRAGYACAGATDYYLETGDAAYKETLDRLWNDMVTTKLYVTGGIGSRSAGEAFGDPYELPNAKAYTESCAAIANLMWNWRMLAATADARYADLMETALYNSINSGMSLSGTMYCYRNPLELSKDDSTKIRNPWYSTICCPPNIERIFASLPGYFFGQSAEGLYVHLYDNSEMNWKLADGSPVRLQQVTKYPWEGAVDLTVSPAAPKEFTLFLRVPAWSESTRVTVGGQPFRGPVTPGKYLAISRNWNPGDAVRIQFDMTPRVLAANPRIADNQGRAAVTRGPIVYAMEQLDQPSGVEVFDTALKLTGKPLQDFKAEFRPDLFGGVVTLQHQGVAATRSFSSMPLYDRIENMSRPVRPASLTLIPYYTFQNRGPSAMQVWTRIGTP